LDLDDQIAEFPTTLVDGGDSFLVSSCKKVSVSECVVS